MADAKVLTRSDGLLTNTSPTGVKYVVEPISGGHALFRIRSTNKTGPEVLDLSGTFTSVSRAQTVLTRYLNEQWKMSDEVASGKRSSKVA